MHSRFDIGEMYCWNGGVSDEAAGYFSEVDVRECVARASRCTFFDTTTTLLTLYFSPYAQSRAIALFHGKD